MDNKKHIQSVELVADKVKSFYENKKPFRIFHGSTNSTRTLTFKRDELLDVSMLNCNISIDTKAQTAIVEPNVPMDKLLAATLYLGLLPPVITEFPGITVGGGIQGGAGESSSFKRGFFSQNINWCEMILADGTVIKSSSEENSDLFYGSAGSMGTLGVITAVEIRLVPAKKYVQLTYIPVNSFESANQTMLEQSNQDIDFLDGIMFGSDSGLIIIGQLTDGVYGKVQRFSRAHDQWFYLHAEVINSQGKEYSETVPLTDYLFRYDRGAFWVGRFAFERFKVPYNRFTRYLLNPILHTRKLYQALQESGASQEHIVQDLSLPYDQAVPFLRYIHDELNIYPLWLCPIKPAPKSPFLCNSLPTNLVINVGVWGPRTPNYDQFVSANRSIELKLAELQGKKWLYAHTYYNEAEFWNIYDKNWYDKLRTKYRATTLPDIYTKTKVRERVEVDAKRGLFKTIFGRAKLRIVD
ncbi:FAD-binding oxidoreductase [Candidatus Saccharibacteria bacterium]|nr:MAG: FAD-binding oxidoreductase [Candidatus Saccharibacteria bacterium]